MDKQIVHPYMDSAVERSEVLIQKNINEFYNYLKWQKLPKKVHSVKLHL